MNMSNLLKVKTFCYNNNKVNNDFNGERQAFITSITSETRDKKKE